jgi:hypothetical protein
LKKLNSRFVRTNRKVFNIGYSLMVKLWSPKSWWEFESLRKNRESIFWRINSTENWKVKRNLMEIENEFKVNLEKDDNKKWNEEKQDR